MALNYIWLSFFVISFFVALAKTFIWGDLSVFPAMTEALFEMAKVGASLSLGFIGGMALWLGIMRIGEKGGAVAILSRLVAPFFSRLFPDVPKDHPAHGSIVMNFSANLLGLDNAATPLGLKAMKELQELNPLKDTASNAQIMFLVLNTSGLTIIPVSVMILRSSPPFNAPNPADIFIPILIATYCSSFVGLLVTSLIQRINLFQGPVLLWLIGMTTFITGTAVYFQSLTQGAMQAQSAVFAALFIFSIIVGFLVLAVMRGINVYEEFVEGAKEGFGVAVKIIPFLVAMLVAVGVFRASGSLDGITDSLKAGVGITRTDDRWVDAVPTALMKPLSGSGARGMASEAMENYGVDSFQGRLACTFQGSTETTFYVLAVYFGSVGIRKTRYALTAGLTADFAGILAAIFVAYAFFG
ncbi:nucleoside recognition domain-containing protein [Roseibacillus persicicus]|uniref:Membrane protein n=1 Tax=Roseibacillus persicicus TaxID=454148 RepID=A0A918WL77_9BACT|nr:spore maturation protein [Roseibacillus persicicus]GHC55711.1 membrane protein [Roseibacillus persicicus]